MAAGEVGERFPHARDDLHRMLRDGMGETADGLVQRRGERLDREALEGLDQRVGKAEQPIAVLDDVGPLHVIEHLAHLLAACIRGD